MKGNWRKMTVGDIVSMLPLAAGVFKAYGIDYCCGGRRLLSSAAEEQRADLAEIEEKLDYEYQKAQQSRDEVDFKSLKNSELASYIESTHHAYLYKALPQISKVFGSVLAAHGRNHPELFELHKTFSGLRGDLEQHLVKEETMLFPDIDGEVTLQMRELSRIIKEEHEQAGKALRELRRISSDYSLPQDACPTYQKLFEMLQELESDLHQHIHLENNVMLVDM